MRHPQSAQLLKLSLRCKNTTCETNMMKCRAHHQQFEAHNEILQKSATHRKDQSHMTIEIGEAMQELLHAAGPLTTVT